MMWTGNYGHEESHLVLKLPGVDAANINTTGPDTPQLSYNILGPSAPAIVTNKTILGETNDVAANRLRFGTNTFQLTHMQPIAGQSLIFDGTNIVWGDSAAAGPTSSVTQIVYVRSGGSDTTGDGTILSPYASITRAMSITTDALWEKRYMIDLGPGNWTENFSWRAWVFIRGSYVFATRLTGIIDINNSSWGVAGTHSDARAGAQDINFSGTVTLNFASVLSSFGKFYFINCNMNNLLQITGYNPINQCIVEGGIWFGGITATGVNILWNGVSGQGGTITLNSSTTACQFNGFGGGLIGNLAVSRISDVPPSVTLIDCPVLGSVNISGAGVILSATNSSLPSRSNITVVGGATLTRLTDAYSLAYIPAVSSQWHTQPDNIADALDILAARISMSGVATLGALGTVTIPNIHMPMGSSVIITVQPGPAPAGIVRCSSIVVGDNVSVGGFTITSTNTGDVGVVVYYQVWV